MKETETIELDRENLKNGQTTKGFSYLPFLITKKEKSSIPKISKISTYDLFSILEESLDRRNKLTLIKLERIKRKIMKREDLYSSVLNYLKNREIKDEIYYWAPGHKISNIFTFIAEMIPDFVKIYKEYFMKQVGREMGFTNVLYFIKERFADEYQAFEIILSDTKMFNNVISQEGWIGDNDIGDVSPNFLSLLEIDNKIDLTEDLKANLAPTVSYLEIEIFNKKFVPNLVQFEGLLNKNENHKKWWLDNGLKVEEWDELKKTRT